MQKHDRVDGLDADFKQISLVKTFLKFRNIVIEHQYM